MSDGTDKQPLRVERRGHVVVAHMDDGKANALSASLIASLKAVVLDAEADPDVAAVVIHGRAGCFSGGFDLNVMRAGDMHAITDLVSDGGELVRACYGAGVPVVAAATGHALAAGALLLLGCDHRVGADIEAKVGLPEVAIKMALPAWAVTIATERLSRRHLQRALVNGHLTTPAASVDAGFLDEVTAADSVLERAVEVATQLADTIDPAAYAAIVESLRGDALRRMDAEVAAARTR